MADPARQSRPRPRERLGLVLAACALISGCLGTETPSPAGSSPTPSAPASPEPSFGYPAPAQLDDGWTTAGLTEVGLQSAPIEELAVAIRDGEFEKVQGVVVVKDGMLVMEEYPGGYRGERTHDVASVTKSVTSILVGIATDQGLIPDVATPVAELFPAYRELIEADPRKADLQLRHLLSMTAGLEWDETSYPYGDSRNDCTKAEANPDPVAFVLGRPVVDEPGTVFAYSCGLSNLLAAIIQDRTGMRADAFGDRYLFGPLGITAYQWDRLPSGISDAGGGLSLRARDMAKIGRMMLDGGTWAGTRVVSPAWVDASTRLDTPTGEGPEYGYQWWGGSLFVRGRTVETYFASGFGGQAIFIVPGLDLVVVFLQQVVGNPLGTTRLIPMLTRYVLPAAMPSDGPAPPDLDQADLDRLTGTFRSSDDGSLATFSREGESLFMISDAIDRTELVPETSTRFGGTVFELIDFTVVAPPGSGPADRLDVYIDFRHLTLERVTTG